MEWEKNVVIVCAIKMKTLSLLIRAKENDYMHLPLTKIYCMFDSSRNVFLSLQNPKFILFGFNSQPFLKVSFHIFHSVFFLYSAGQKLAE